MEMGGKRRAVIVGGSIAGVSCAHALISVGWDVVVIEKSRDPPAASPAGAGLGLDPQSIHFINSWLSHPQLLEAATIPLSIDQNQTIDVETKESWRLTRDESFNFRAAYWSDLHCLLHKSLPQHIFLWGHLFLSFTTSPHNSSVKVKARVINTQEIVELEGDLIVAADGCLSLIRKTFLPDLKLRYSGYCAWRGVFDFAEEEDSATVTSIRRVYPELGKCLYFDLASGTHTVLYELPNKKLNWIWYTNQPEPQLKGTSVTMNVSQDMIHKMHEEADRIWLPELAKLMKETEKPFVNVIYDCDPLEQIFWDKVVLVGDAAHPTTPHGLRSTNMSILDAAVLGKCLEKWGAEDLGSALKDYQRIRLPVTSKQVLHSRLLGRIKQGLLISDREPFNPKMASSERLQELQQKAVPFFAGVPIS